MARGVASKQTAVTGGSWPRPGLPFDRRKLTLPPRCPAAAKVSLLARPRIAGPGQELPTTAGSFLALPFVDSAPDAAAKLKQSRQLMSPLTLGVIPESPAVPAGLSLTLPPAMG
jgi:hypothetical protein